MRGSIIVSLAFLSSCAAPGREVQFQEGDFALIEIQLRG